MDKSIIFTIFAASSNKNKDMKAYKVIDVLRLLRKDGWYQLKGTQTNGDHRQFKHPTKKGRVTVNGKESDVLSQYVLNKIWKQAGWKN